MLAPFCLSCGSALDEHRWCATCEAFADDPPETTKTPPPTS